MEIHQLRYFLALARECSFTKAAEACYVSQPALSQQIIKLEKEIGYQLIDREGRSISLTPVGQLMHEEATKILLAVDTAFSRLTDSTAFSEGSLTIGAIPTIAPYILPPVLREFQVEFPKAAISFTEIKTNDIVSECLSGGIDIGIVALPIDHDGIETVPFYTEDLVAILPEKHRLTKDPAIPLGELTSEPFVLLHEGHCLGDQVASICDANSSIPTIRCKSAQLNTVFELVRAGMGVSMVPEMALNSNQPKIASRAIEGMVPQRTLAAIHSKKRYLRKLSSKFIEFLQSHVE